MERTIIWNKSLEIDEKFLTDIEDIYKTILKKPEYILKTKDNAEYQFNSKEELIKFSFDEDIISLDIDNTEFDIENNIKFNFRIWEGFIINYSQISECRYRISNNDLDSVLKDKILKLYKNNTKSDWAIGKYGIFLPIIITLIILFIIYIIVKCIMDSNFLKGDINISRFLIVYSIISISLTFSQKLDKIVCNKFFTPIVYMLGFQKKKWEKNLKLRENIFWGIIVSTMLSVIISMVI